MLLIKEIFFVAYMIEWLLFSFQKIIIIIFLMEEIRDYSQIAK